MTEKMLTGTLRIKAPICIKCQNKLMRFCYICTHFICFKRVPAEKSQVRQCNYKAHRSQKEVVLAEICIGHTGVTHSYLQLGEEQPQFVDCKTPLTVCHFLWNMSISNE